MAGRENWHIEKSISVGHMLTSVSMLIVGIMFVTDIKEDVSVLSEKTDNVEKYVERIDKREQQHNNETTQEIKELRGELLDRDVRIEQKLDKLIERELDK